MCYLYRKTKMQRTLRTLCLFSSLAHGWLTHAQTAGRSFNVVGTTIVETQKAIREGRTTCRAVVASYLARIQAYDQTPIDGLRLNAIVTINPDALAEADACDRNFAATHKLPPLGGIAVLIKDNYDTQGLQTTGGSLAMRGFVPAGDATMVARLRAAGAIVLAKTNMAEWAFSPYLTASSIAGITRNPYDLTRVPAGSSGGTAAGVAASLGESGLGTDTGNSIRGPSSHNDLVGIRPTIGLTSRSGIIPLFAHNDVGGPMARTVADAAALLTVVAGPDPADPVTQLDADRPHGRLHPFSRPAWSARRTHRRLSPVFQRCENGPRSESSHRGRRSTPCSRKARCWSIHFPFQTTMRWKRSWTAATSRPT